MKSIQIARRLHPFSHRPGTSCPLPGSDWKVDVFPALLRLAPYIGGQALEFSLSYQDKSIGPVKGFTVELDLEKGCVRVWGFSSLGYVRYQVIRTDSGIQIILEKAPAPLQFGEKTLREGDLWHLPLVLGSRPLPSQERLCLGVHKSQEWEGVMKRLDLQEIFPFWLKMGQSVSLQEGVLVASLEELLASSFSGILSPHSGDLLYQGIFQEDPYTGSSPLCLLTQGAWQIRSLFFEEESEGYKLLPCSQFPSGRYIGIVAKSGATFSIEWSKYKLRRVLITCASPLGVMRLFLPKEVRSLRMRTHLKEKGTRIDVEKGVCTIPQGEQTILLDRFEK